MVYSISKAGLEYSINSETQQSLSCITLANGITVYSGTDHNVLVWNLDRRKMIEYILAMIVVILK